MSAPLAGAGWGWRGVVGTPLGCAGCRSGRGCGTPIGGGAAAGRDGSVVAPAGAVAAVAGCSGPAGGDGVVVATGSGSGAGALTADSARFWLRRCGRVRGSALRTSGGWSSLIAAMIAQIPAAVDSEADECLKRRQRVSDTCRERDPVSHRFIGSQLETLTDVLCIKRERERRTCGADARPASHAGAGFAALDLDFKKYSAYSWSTWLSCGRASRDASSAL